MLQFLDYFFLISHSLFIVFNLFGWIFVKTRTANLITLTLTAFSWVVLGYWYGGFGYCPLTDWHWEVRMKLGYYDLPYSYIKFLIDRCTGLDIDAQLVELLTIVCFSGAMIASIYVNLRDWLKKRK